VAFLGVTYARAVAAPLNPNYKLVGTMQPLPYMLSTHANTLTCQFDFALHTAGHTIPSKVMPA